MKATAEKVEAEIQQMWIIIRSLKLDDGYHGSNDVLFDSALSHMNTAIELAQEIEAERIELSGTMDKIRGLAS